MNNNRDKSLSLKEYAELIKYINENHEFGSLKDGSKHIKYIDTTFDTRTSTIYRVALRGFEVEKEFTTVNGGMDGYNSLKEGVMDYLENGL